MNLAGFQRRSIAWALLATLAIVAAVVWFSLSPDRQALDDDAESPIALARTGLAATEDLDFQAAEQAWNTLRQSRAGDASVAKNWTLNRVLEVDSLTATTLNRSVSDEARQNARGRLPDAIGAARESIDALETLIEDKVLILWLRSRVDLQEASLLPASLMRSRTQQTYDQISDFIRESGGASDATNTLILGGTLAEILERRGIIEDLPSNLLRDAAEVFAKVSNANPDNLFLASFAAKLHLVDQSPTATALIRRAANLADVIAPELQARAGGAIESPSVLVDQVINDIESGDWNAAASGFGIWFNLVNSSELMKADRRRAAPHPLDQLSFETLRQLSRAGASGSPVQTFDGELAFSANAVPDTEGTTAAIVMDLNLDLLPDLVTASDAGVLTLHRQEADATWNQVARLETDLSIRGMTATDLFMVDRAAPGKVKVLPASDDDNASTADPDFSVGLRHNIVPTLVVFGSDGVRLFGVDGRDSTPADRRLQAVDNETGLEDVTGVLAVADGDLEGDGDLDLIIATERQGLRLFINRGTRRFFEVGSIEENGIRDLAIADLDRDLDLDVITVQPESGVVGILENLLHLQFRHRPLTGVPATPGVRQVDVAEIDGNVSWDLFLSGDEATNMVFSQTADTGVWTVESRKTLEATSGRRLFADFDNDSLPESLTKSARQTTEGRLQHIQVNASEDSPGSVPVKLDASVSRLGGVTDFDNNGRLDWFGWDEDGVHVFLNTTEADGHHLQVRLKGIDDNSAASGRVNHYAIGSVLELRFGPHYRSQIITTPMTHFGLDGYAKADSMRIIFPNGLTQSVRSPAVDTLLEEEQTLKGSCPYLYAWNGTEFAFVTDCLWAAPLGLQVARGVVAKDRPWEYLKVDGRHVAEKDGAYEFRITEELWEVAYFDHVSLATIDHPADVEIHTNEKVGPGFIAEPTIFAFPDSSRRPVELALDTSGRDVTEKLASVDQDFVQGFDRRILQGLCPPHWIDLTVPADLVESADVDDAIYLVLSGWILPTDTSLNIQIDQNAEMPPVEYPSVWVPKTKIDDASDEESWEKVIPFMGFPGGKTKTIVVEVTDVLNREDLRVRIRTSAQIYWDAAMVALADASVDLIRHDLNLETAEVAKHGFSRRLKPSSQEPETYIYGQTQTSPKWPPLAGPLTRLGDVGGLLDKWDDAMVLISGGDEIRLRFKVPDAPVPDGYVRDFVLHCVGWDKDADLNTLSGQSTLPLPFRSMSTYPPTMQDSDSAVKVERLNRQHLTRQQRYHEFWHRR